MATNHNAAIGYKGRASWRNIRVQRVWKQPGGVLILLLPDIGNLKTPVMGFSRHPKTGNNKVRTRPDE